MKFIDELFAGPIDIVGDVHGEIDALERLLGCLGYAADGRHAEGRRLAFLGDLTDRGPDSPAVLKKVRALVDAGFAQLILGNHELNLLRNVNKHGNSWWVKPDAPGEHPAIAVDVADKPKLLRFLQRQPVAREREDLRIVHACWNAGAIAQLRAHESEGLSVLDLYNLYANDSARRWAMGSESELIRNEWQAYGEQLSNRDWKPVYLPAMAERDRQYQMNNPVRILTSGEEHPTHEPFWAGGKWRMLERVKWWESYDEQLPVIIGHYWRRFSQARTVFADKFGPDLFAGIEPHHWMGQRKNVYCVDFSVGGRYAQRAENQPEQFCSLAAVRVPEWRVVHDNGEVWQIT